MSSRIEEARKLAAEGQGQPALDAFAGVLQDENATQPERLEAALYIFATGHSYQIAYQGMVALYNEGFQQGELLDIMVQAFYAPNLNPQRETYRRNVKRLGKYKYLFCAEGLSFPAFDDLPVKFFPFDDNGYLPMDMRQNRFAAYVDPNYPVVSRNFFHDLEKPVFAADVYFQYELEYLNDNVRPSEWCARENHIYLHYTDWPTFCSWLQVLDFSKLVKSEKIVFLIEDQAALYPIDFKERFGVDYSRMTPREVGVREVQRLIWHTQLATHNGGDFFNEVFDGHPNLLLRSSVMFGELEKTIRMIKENVHKKGFAERMAEQAKRAAQKESGDDELDYLQFTKLIPMRDLTDKDILVAFYMYQLPNSRTYHAVDPTSRIAPALFFQPHFGNITYTQAIYDPEKSGEAPRAVLESKQYEAIRNSKMFEGFKYIKTFTPLRRVTTSVAASTKFSVRRQNRAAENGEKPGIIVDMVNIRLLNRSYLVDPEDRLCVDSRIVRFEDAKLNPKATFTALAEFLDLPYDHCMEECTGIVNKNGGGFSIEPVYRTYDEYMGEPERYFLELLSRELYEHYGYGFQYYDGAEVSEERLREIVEGFTVTNGYIAKAIACVFEYEGNKPQFPDGETPEARFALGVEAWLKNCNENRLETAHAQLQGLQYVNKYGVPLRYMELLRLNEALLERPMYH